MFTDADYYDTKFPVLPSAKSLLQLALCSAETILNVPTIEVKSVEETAILPDFTLVSILQVNATAESIIVNVTEASLYLIVVQVIFVFVLTVYVVVLVATVFYGAKQEFNAVTAVDGSMSFLPDKDFNISFFQFLSFSITTYSVV